MRELQKGTKSPYHGYLLNIGEYEKYTKFMYFLEKYKPLFESQNIDNF